jgi:hypothetical protein
MSLMGSAAVIVLFDRAPGTTEEFRHWHDREHMPERLGIPGFLRGRRFRSIQVGQNAGPEFLVLYEAADLAVLTGEAYLERLNNPTPLSRRVGPLARRNTRGTCVIEFSTGIGSGGIMFALRFEIRPCKKNRLREFLLQTLPAVARESGVLGVHWCVTNREASAAKVEERRNRTIDMPDSLVLVEGTCAEAVRSAVARNLCIQQMVDHGAEAVIAEGLYTLELSLCADDLGR